MDAVGVQARDVRWTLLAPPAGRIGNVLRGTGRPYECDLLDMLRAVIPEGSLVVDAGANIGNHTAYFALVARARVEAFEPNPTALDYLRANVALNGLEDRVRVHAVALGEFSGRGALRDDNPDAGLGTETVVTDPEGPIKVLRLDDLDLREVRAIKVDVEGAEESVLRGALDILERDRPVVVAEAQDSPRRIEGLLHPLGYRRLGMQLAYTPTWIYAAHRTDKSRLLLSKAAIRYGARRARRLLS